MRVVFTKSKKKLPIGSWAIRLYQQTEYSHVALEFKENGELYYFHANEGKVSVEHKQHFDREHEIVFFFKVPVTNKLLKSLKKEQGRNYGSAQNLGIILVDIIKNIYKRITNPISYGVNCSEIIYTQVIVPLYGDRGYDPDSIKPKHIFKILKDLNCKCS